MCVLILYDLCVCVDTVCVCWYCMCWYCSVVCMYVLADVCMSWYNCVDTVLWYVCMCWLMYVCMCWYCGCVFDIVLIWCMSVLILCRALCIFWDLRTIWLLPLCVIDFELDYQRNLWSVVYSVDLHTYILLIFCLPRQCQSFSTLCIDLYTSIHY